MTTGTAQDVDHMIIFLISSGVLRAVANHRSRMTLRWRTGPPRAGDDSASVQACKQQKSLSRQDCPRLALNFAPLNQRGRRENRMPAAPAALCAMFGKKAHKLHSPQGSTDIRFSLHDGRDALFRALSVHRDPDRAHCDRDTPFCGPGRFGPIH
jgi:hypothetical protein